MRDLKQDTYLGDGLYAGYDEEMDHVVLYSHNGMHATNSVYLDASVLAAFKEYLEKLTGGS